MAEVKWSPTANRHLGNILSVISKEAGGAAALKWNRRFLKASRQLERFPEIGSPVEDLSVPGFREQIVGPYRMIYRFDGLAIHMAFVLRADQDLDRALIEAGLRP